MIPEPFENQRPEFELASGDRAATILILPEEPNCVRLADGKRLISFVHNRKFSDKLRNLGFGDRQEPWLSLSKDDGKSWSWSWSWPQFVASNIAPASEHSYREISYADLLVDDNDLHPLLDEEKRLILHIHFRADELHRLPTSIQ